MKINNLILTKKTALFVNSNVLKNENIGQNNFLLFTINKFYNTLLDFLKKESPFMKEFLCYVGVNIFIYGINACCIFQFL